MWNELFKKWALRCRLTVKPAGLIPAKSVWFIVADDDYPWGDIELYPAKDGGIKHTFPHQSHNAEGNPDVPWREGKICVRTSLRYAGRRAYDIEPTSPEERLRWHVMRAKEWLEAAAAGRVAEVGEPFELPDFPRRSHTTLGFIEDEDSFRFWQEETVEVCGVATVVQPDGVNAWYAVTTFSNARGKTIREVEYGALLRHGTARKLSAMWIRLPRIPVIHPWQAPATFGELRAAMKEQGVDFNPLFFDLARDFRDGKRHILLVGFPIPTTIGGEPAMYHWQALQLPVLTHGKVKGFRPKEGNFAMNDARTVLSDSSSIDWIISRNWSEQQIRTRGRASSSLTGAKVLIVGAGAIGSSVAEILVREGCQRIVVVDGDILEVGNLCRHTLSIQEIQTPKAESLAARLNSISPHVTAEGVRRYVHNTTEVEQRKMAECTIVIDCTGDDRAAFRLSTFPWEGNKLFVSISTGLQARRLFLFGACGERFPHHDFSAMLTPWLDKELKEHKGFELPPEGLGCWHPVFPARSDDIWLLSSIAVKCIDSWMTNPPRSPRLCVFEQEQKDEFPPGIKLVQ
ncbi:MAG: ThiF family adenylyltransferase [bacterium]